MFGRIPEGTTGEVVEKNESRRWLSGEIYSDSVFDADSESGSLFF